MTVHEIARLTTLFSAITIIAAILTVAGYYFYSKVYRKRAPKGAKSFHRVDYDALDRKDSTDFVKFDTIVDFGGFGAIVSRSHTKFTAMMELSGFEYAMASLEEKRSVIDAAVNACMVYDTPLQIRQDARPVDLSPYIGQCKDAIDQLKARNRLLQQQANEMRTAIEPLLKDDSVPTQEEIEQLEQYRIRFTENDREQSKNEYLIEEQRAIIKNLARNSGVQVRPERHNYYIFSWQYDVREYTSKNLTSQEIYQEAKKKLEQKASSLSDALSRSRVHTRLAGAEECLIEMYDHYHPLTRGTVKTEILKNSSLYHLFTTVERKYAAFMLKRSEESEDEIG